MGAHAVLAGTILGLAALGAHGQPAPPFPPSTVDPRWAFDAFFSKSGVALASTERERLLAFMEHPFGTLAFAQTPEGSVARPFCKHLGWVVVGHADPSEGTSSVARGVASRRAQYVAEFLSRHGAAASSICRLDHGAARPAVSSPSDKNRRVEMEVICSGAPIQCN